MPYAVMRFPSVRELTGLSRSTIWRLEQEGDFPARMKLSKSSVGWRTTEVAKWLDKRERGARAQPISLRRVRGGSVAAPPARSRQPS